MNNIFRAVGGLGLALVIFSPRCGWSESVIREIVVVPVNGRVEVRVMGDGELSAKIMIIEEELKLVLDFAGASYEVPKYALREPGLGDVRVVRGGQFQSPPADPSLIARVVVELKTLVAYTHSQSAGKYILSLATSAGATSPQSEPEVKAAKKPPAKVAPVESEVPRARVLHAMVTDLPDRVRLVVTADGVLRYKLSSRNNGQELYLALYDVDLKWSPPKLTLKEGPIVEVRAKQVQKPSRQVQIKITLRDARPYYVQRDQNQVVIEVEKALQAAEEAVLTSHGGDLNHLVTLNVQDEDLYSLIKALAFEAGFDNLVLNRSVKMTGGTVTISLRDISFSKALTLILAPNGLVWKIERGVLRVATSVEFDAELETTALSGGGAGGTGGIGNDSEESGIVTRVFKLQYISVFDISGEQVESGLAISNPTLQAPTTVPTKIVQAITDILISKARGKVTVDARSNSLIITDVASNMRQIARLIQELDVKIPQVHIQARLVQVNYDVHDAFGINWTGERVAQTNPSLNASGQLFGTGIAERSYQLVTGFLGPGFNLDATLAVMQERGQADLLLNPSITTLHDRAATVKTTKNIQFTQATTIIGAGGVPITTETFQTIPIPIEMGVRPHVNPDGTVLLDVVITMTTVLNSAVPPDTAEQMASTRLLVRNRETGVIGGMLTDETRKVVRKVPVLGSLPWFLGGAFFRSEHLDKVKLELMLFLTPTIAEDI